MRNALKRLFRLGGPIRSLAGWGLVAKALAGILGWTLTAAALETWWAAMPLWFVKVPAVVSGGGLGFLFGVWAFERWRNVPALPDPFHEDLRQFSRDTATFTQFLYGAFYQFQQRRDTDPKVWSSVVDTGDLDVVSEFAAALYPPNGNTSPEGFHKRSPLLQRFPVEAFEEFHRARSDMTAFLARWHPRLMRDSRAREQAFEYLSVESTVRVLKVLEELELALAEALGNTVREDAGWRVLIEKVAEYSAAQGRGVGRAEEPTATRGDI